MYLFNVFEKINTIFYVTYKLTEMLSELCYRTLYCAKGNYEFGISRVIKSLEPYQKKLGTDTWFYAKRCFLSLIENMAKHMIMIRDTVITECIQFLECCESESGHYICYSSNSYFSSNIVLHNFTSNVVIT